MRSRGCGMRGVVYARAARTPLIMRIGVRSAAEDESRFRFSSCAFALLKLRRAWSANRLFFVALFTGC